MIVEIIPCLSDNYSYLIHEKETGTISIVDPSEFNTCDKIIRQSQDAFHLEIIRKAAWKENMRFKML